VSILAGPVNIGEEYRFNVPVIYYSYTPEFLSYFGQKGVDEIEKSIAVLNNLPSASQAVLDSFPLASQRVNHRASALGLIDLKSITLTVLLQELGLGDPTFYVYTLRNRWIWAGGAPTNYYVIKRNFDPVTWEPSSYINGQLWTYPLVTDTGPASSFVFTQPVDPLALGGLINAPVSSDLLSFGGFWTGLTRDDMGGLKYIYRNNNYNVENAPPTAFSSGGGGGPWGIPGGVTNATFVNLAVRSGREKIEFRRANYDSLFGFFPAFTNSFSDTFVTNGVNQSQGLQRPLVIADILFDAGDLQGGDDNGGIFPAIGTVIQVWSNNDAFNGIVGDSGPGVIDPSTGIPALTLTFNNVGPAFFNIFPNFLNEQSAGTFFRWGSFDGSTNEPAVYPYGASIQAIEQQVLGSSTGTGGNPWTIP
jgi:hypothetical protein